MRFGTKLVAVGVIAMLSAPASGGATGFRAQTEYFREVQVSAPVSALNTDGKLKKGTMTFRLRVTQGVSQYQPPLSEGVATFEREEYTGLGFNATTTTQLGLPHFTGCLTLVIPTVINATGACRVEGHPFLESDPMLDEVQVGATMAGGNDYDQTLTLTIEGVDELARRDDNNADLTPDGSVRKAGYVADVDEVHQRPGNLVSGQVTDPLRPLMYIDVREAKVTLRTGLLHDSYVTRGPLFCPDPGALHKEVGAPSLGVHPDLDGDGEGEYLDEFLPMGCYPDALFPGGV